MIENRRHPRAPIELEVTYQRLNSFFSDYTRNISRGGMFVRTSKPLPVGTRFVFRLRIPPREASLELTGEVVHASNDGGSSGMGLRFVWEDDGARQEFERLVEQLMVERLGAQVAGEILSRSRGH